MHHLLPIIQKEGFGFREMKIADAGHIFEIHDDTETRLFTRLVRQQSLADIRSWLNYYPHYKRHGFGIWAIVHDDSQGLAGLCGLRVRKDLDNAVDISYRIHPSWRRQGIASAAVLATVKWGLMEFGIKNILAQVHEDNAYSRRIMDKTGFKEIDKDDIWITYKIDEQLFHKANEWARNP